MTADRRADDGTAVRRRARVPAALLAAELVRTKISRRIQAGGRFFVRSCYLALGRASGSSAGQDPCIARTADH